MTQERQGRQHNSRQVKEKTEDEAGGTKAMIGGLPSQDFDQGWRTDDYRNIVVELIRILEGIYNDPVPKPMAPLDLLLATILSQNTNDSNCLKAFRALRRAYPDYRQILSASDEEIALQIREAGLGRIKAPRIKAVLARVLRDAGAFDLSFLGSMSMEEAREYLLSMEGVGPKTAAVVLLFSFGFPTMPVDTHVHRLARRIGLVPPKAGIKEIQERLEAITPPEKYLSLHMNLIRHGRRVCRARAPDHQNCPLRNLCREYQSLLAEEAVPPGTRLK